MPSVSATPFLSAQPKNLQSKTSAPLTAKLTSRLFNHKNSCQSIDVTYKRLISFLMGVVLTILCNMALATQIIVPADISSIRISDKLKYYPEDSSKPPLSLEQARAIPAEQWIQLSANPSFNSALNCCYWFSTTLKFNNDFRGFIEIDRPIIDDMAVYLIVAQAAGQAPTNEIAHYQLGDSFPFATRPIKHNNMLVPVEARAGSSVKLYLRVASAITPVQQFEAKLWSEEQF